MSIISFEKISIVKLVIFFIIYLIAHIGIGVVNKNTKKDLEEKPGNIALTDKFKTTNLIFKWFPAAYICFLLIYFYSIY